MKNRVSGYKSFKEVEYDLKRLNLERQIALEELKSLRGDFKDDLTPPDWVEPAAKVAGGYAIFALLKRLLK